MRLLRQMRVGGLRTTSMSEMGQKPTCCLRCAESALLPKADVRVRATRLLEVGLDFSCKRSVAGEAGGAVRA